MEHHGVVFASFDPTVKPFVDYLGPSMLHYFERVFDGRELRLLGYLRQRTIDHKLPQLRWDPDESEAQTDYGSMSNADIRNLFQLLKKSNGSVSHNLLRSRACETCYKEGRRGSPFGIAFYYNGKWPLWEPEDKQDPSGCVGCGARRARRATRKDGVALRFAAGDRLLLQRRAAVGRWEPEDKQDPSGCVGCGWYDFDAWRKALNQALKW